MKLYRVIFISGMIILLLGIFWGVSVAGRAYNQMMQAPKVPPVIEVKNSNIGYHISFMGNHMGEYPEIKNPIPPEKAKVLVNKISNASQDNRVLDSVIVETERNLYKLWENSSLAKDKKGYIRKINMIKKNSLRLSRDIEVRVKRLMKMVLPKKME